jgi:hypothetical protein
MKKKRIHVTDPPSISPGGSTKSRILALDPANTTGWAVLDMLDREADEQPVVTDGGEESVVASGIFKPRGRITARRLVSAFAWCGEMIRAHDVGVLALEVPYLATYFDRHGRKHQNVKAFRQQCQLGGAYLLAAGGLEVEVMEVIPAQRLTALGLPGNLPRVAAKAQTLLCVNAIYDLALTDHNVADAVAVGVAAARMFRERTVLGEG